jgi:hypothetical protein
MCRYEIHEQKEVPVQCTGIYRPISSTGYKYQYGQPNFLVGVIVTPQCS